MKKILNPWRKLTQFACFGCSPRNDSGLHMDFCLDADGSIACRWPLQQKFAGWPGVLHGGIQCALMDEVAAWVVHHELKVAGVTTKLDTKFLRPVCVSDPYITVRGRLSKTAHNLAWVDCTIENMAQEVCTKAQAVYFTYSKEESLKNFYYSDMEYEDGEDALGTADGNKEDK